MYGWHLIPDMTELVNNNWTSLDGTVNKLNYKGI